MQISVRRTRRSLESSTVTSIGTVGLGAAFWMSALELALVLALLLGLELGVGAVAACSNSLILMSASLLIHVLSFSIFNCAELG